MSDPKRYAGYSDARYLALAAEHARRDKQRTYELLRLAPGARALDVGCGPATDTLALADLVGPEGQVVGVDADREMVGLAEERARAVDLTERVRHVTADAADLPFAPESFDACRAERVFQHLAQPEAALDEMVRVTRPGGRIVVLDTDYSSLTIDSEHTEVERRLARFTAQRLRSGYVARRLRRLFVERGLRDVTVEVSPQTFDDYALVRLGWLDSVERDALAADIVAESEVEAFREGLGAADAAGGFFASLNHILVAGTR